MNLEIIRITFSDVRLFAETMGNVFMETGRYSAEEDFFDFHMKKTMAIEPNKENTLVMIEDFLDIFKDIHRKPHAPSGNKDLFHIEDMPALISFLRHSELEELPLYLNSEDPYRKTIALWRIKIGK